MIELIPVIMIHEDLESFPEMHPISEGYSFSKYEAGETKLWAELQTTTDSFETLDQAFDFFDEEFVEKENQLVDNCYFLRSRAGEYIGSAMAWHADDPFDDSYGRLHWVVIRPDFRGKGLGKQLITFILAQLKKQYKRAYLTTQTTSYQAINIYLNVGFRPLVKTDNDVRAWTILRESLAHPELDTFTKV